jgi:hypothetical protein
MCYNVSMTKPFVQVRREVFLARLAAAGFHPDPEARGEVQVVRQHHMDPTMHVRIYTSLPLEGGNTRAVGADAIRVLLMFKNPQSGRSGCLFKATRVNRTGTEDGVIERTIQRAREAYGEGVKRVKDRQQN